VSSERSKSLCGSEIGGEGVPGGKREEIRFKILSIACLL